MFLEQLFKNPLYFTLAVLVVIVSVCLHEMAHALAAYYLEGDDTARKQGFFRFNPWVQMGPASLVFLLLFGICWGLTRSIAACSAMAGWENPWCPWPAL